MKKITLFSLLLISAFSVNAQEPVKVADDKKEVKKIEYNQWTVEATLGQAKGIRPYSPGYFSSSSGDFLGKPQTNSFSLTTRYMISPKFGLRAGFHFDELKNNKDNGSLPFKMQMIGFSIQGVVNANRLFDIESLGKLGLLLHGGIRVDAMTSKTENTLTTNQNFNNSEYNGGFILGVTPQYRFSKKMALQFDVSYQNNIRQHFNWDGSSAAPNSNLSAQMLTTSFGLSYSIGSNDIHGDWAIVKENTLALEEIEALEKRMDSMETLMNDTDKDGVADYLDQENNSTAGVTVDSRGKMVDLNKNGVPDEMERYFNTSSKDASKTDAVNRFINDGYVSVYFDTGKTKPTSISIEGIEFIKTYMKNNPSKSIVIFGHADEVTQTANNDRLATERALSVKDILVRSGIRAARLFIASDSDDSSGDKKSSDSRKLVKRVTFKILD